MTVERIERDTGDMVSWEVTPDEIRKGDQIQDSRGEWQLVVGDPRQAITHWLVPLGLDPARSLVCPSGELVEVRRSKGSA